MFRMEQDSSYAPSANKVMQLGKITKSRWADNVRDTPVNITTAPVKSNCLNIAYANNTNYYIYFASNTSWASLTYLGTATAALDSANSRIAFSGTGTIYNIKIWDGAGGTGTVLTHLPCAEGCGNVLYDVVGTNCGTIYKDVGSFLYSTLWTTTQDVYHHNLSYGYLKTELNMVNGVGVKESPAFTRERVDQILAKAAYPSNQVMICCSVPFTSVSLDNVYIEGEVVATVGSIVGVTVCCANNYKDTTIVSDSGTGLACAVDANNRFGRMMQITTGSAFTVVLLLVEMNDSNGICRISKLRVHSDKINKCYVPANIAQTNASIGWADNTVTARTASNISSVFCCGDSLTEGYSIGSWNAWPQVLATKYGTYIDIRNKGHIGYTIANLVSVYAAQSAFATGNKIAILEAGTNDLNNGRTVSQVITDLEAFATTMKADGFTVWAVTFYYDADRGKGVALRNAIMASTVFDDKIDFYTTSTDGAGAPLATMISTTDNTHWTSEGHRQMSLLAIAKIGTLSHPVITNAVVHNGAETKLRTTDTLLNKTHFGMWKNYVRLSPNFDIAKVYDWDYKELCNPYFLNYEQTGTQKYGVTTTTLYHKTTFERLDGKIDIFQDLSPLDALLVESAVLCNDGTKAYVGKVTDANHFNLPQYAIFNFKLKLNATPSGYCVAFMSKWDASDNCDFSFYFNNNLQLVFVTCVGGTIKGLTMPAITTGVEYEFLAYINTAGSQAMGCKYIGGAWTYGASTFDGITNHAGNGIYFMGDNRFSAPLNANLYDIKIATYTSANLTAFENGTYTGALTVDWPLQHSFYDRSGNGHHAEATASILWSTTDFVHNNLWNGCLIDTKDSDPTNRTLWDYRPLLADGITPASASPKAGYTNLRTCLPYRDDAPLNLSETKIQMPDISIYDKSSTTYYEDALRGTAFYDATSAATKRTWYQEELNGKYQDSVTKSGYKNRWFCGSYAQVLDGSNYGLTGRFRTAIAYSTAQTGNALRQINKFLHGKNYT